MGLFENVILISVENMFPYGPWYDMILMDFTGIIIELRYFFTGIHIDV